MKKVTGNHSDFSNQVELDQEALDAVEEFADGQITFDTLKSLIGPEAAASIKEQRHEHDPDSYFDDPESL